MRRIAIVQDLINAYEDHSRTDFDAHLKRLEEMLRYTGPLPTPPLAPSGDVLAEAVRTEMQRRLDQAKP